MSKKTTKKTTKGKAKAAKRPADAADEHARLKEIEAAEKRLRAAEREYDDARRACKDAVGVVTARTKALRALTSDTADGQARFSDPGPLRDWREIPIEELGLARSLTQKVCAWGAGLNTMGELADFAAGPLGDQARRDLTEKQRSILADRIEAFWAEHPEALETVAEPAPPAEAVSA